MRAAPCCDPWVLVDSMVAAGRAFNNALGGWWHSGTHQVGERQDDTKARRDPMQGREETGSAAAVPSQQAAYDDLQCYTLTRGDPAFIHQHVVDGWAAQHADERTKPIALTFALVGLYLRVVRRFSGRQVQRVHMTLARQKRNWPLFALPKERGSVTTIDVVAAPVGPERDQAIDAWCASVWDAFGESHQAVAELLEQHGIG